MSGVNYHAWTHRPKSEGGTDPIEFGSEVAILTGWEAETDGLVAPGAWHDAAAVGFAFFNDGYMPLGYNVNLDAGTITAQVDTMYYAMAIAQFSDDFDEGDIVAVAINETSSSQRAINQITCGAGGALGTSHIAVARAVWNVITPPVIEVNVYHDHATDQTLNSVTLVVSRQIALEDSNWITHA